MATRTAKTLGSPPAPQPTAHASTPAPAQDPAAPRPRRKARVPVPAGEAPPAASEAAHAERPRTRRGTRSGPAKEATVPKNAARARPAPRAPEKPLSALDAAWKVLSSLPRQQAKDGLTAPQLIDRMAEAKLWTSPGGKTPAATLSAAITREMAAKGDAARFRKLGPGRFGVRDASPSADARLRFTDPLVALLSKHEPRPVGTASAPGDMAAASATLAVTNAKRSKKRKTP